MTDIAKIEGGEIVIRIPISALPDAALYAWDRRYGFEQHNLHVGDLPTFTDEFLRYLTDDTDCRRDGSILERALDEALVETVEQGAFGICDGLDIVEENCPECARRAALRQMVKQDEEVGL